MIDEVRTTSQHALAQEYLVRVGNQGQTLVCLAADGLVPQRSATLVVQSDRGEQLGVMLREIPPPLHPEEQSNTTNLIVRLATEADLALGNQRIAAANSQFEAWQERIESWSVDVELMDLEWTLDGNRLLIYVLNERGPECTKLALMAAAKGHGIVEVVPLSSDGITTPKNSGCGSGNCGRH